MKHLNEYIQEQLIDEGIISDLFKGFWEWLTGKGNKKEYDPTSIEYDEKEKVKYINKFTSDDVVIKPIEDKKQLSKILSNSENKDDSKRGFFRIKEHFKNHPEHNNVNDSYKWLTSVFKTKDLTESCTLIGITNCDENLKETPVVFIYEDLPIYKYVINYGDIVNALKEIDQNIVIKDPRLISQLKKNEIKIEAVEGNKGYYTLD